MSEKEPNKVRTSITIDPVVLDKLRAAAHTSHTSVSKFIEDALKEKLNNASK